LLQVKIAETAEDKEIAFSIRKKVFVEEQGIPVHIELDDYDASATHFIIFDQNTPIAAARLRLTDAFTGKVERVCVLPEHRGKHFGVYVMKAIEDYAKTISLHTLKLNAQTYAIPFYEKLNFEITSPEFNDAGIPHRAMEKQLLD
jgi:predicted GNAT family N-acyltransferase